MMNCQSRDCDRMATLAIKTTDLSRYGLTHTLYNDDEVAPRNAQRYCVKHGMHLMAELARLSDPEGSRDE